MDTLITVISIPISRRFRSILRCSSIIIVGLLASTFIITGGYYYYQKHALIEHKKEDLAELGTTLQQRLDEAYLSMSKLVETYAQDARVIQTLSPSRPAPSPALNNFVLNHKNQQEFSDFLLVNEKGTIVYSLDKKLHNQNINDASLRTTNCAHAVQRALMTTSRTTSRLSFFPPAQQQSIFFAFPVLDSATKRLLGIAALRFSGKYFYRLLRGFKTLGRRAELVLGEKQGEYVQIINNVRLNHNATFKPIRMGSSKAHALQDALNGKSGLGATTDYRGKTTLATWFPLVAFQLGLVLKVDLDEVLTPLRSTTTALTILAALLLLLLAITTFLALCTTAFAPQKIVQKMQALVAAHRYAFKGMAFITLLLGAYTIYRTCHMYYVYHAVYNTTLRDIRTELDTMQRKIEYLFKKTNSATNDIIHKVKLGQTSYINDILRKNSIDHQQLVTLLVASDLGNFIHVYTRPQKDSPLHNIDKPTDQQRQFVSQLKKTLTDAPSAWLPPMQDPFSGQQIIGFAQKIISPDGQSFYSFAAIPSDIITSIVQNLQIGDFGYAFLFDHQNNIIYHPIAHFIGKKAHTIDAQKNADAHILFALTQLDDTSRHYFDQVNRWLETRILKPSKWKLYFAYHKDFINEYLDPATQWRHRLSIIFLAVLTLLCIHLCAVAYRLRLHPFFKSFIFALIGLVGLLIMIRHVYHSPLQQHSTMAIETSSILEQLKNNISERLSQKNQQRPYFIPTGILLHTISFDNEDNSILFQGHAWQKIPKNAPITPGLKLKSAKPQSIYSEKMYDVPGDDGRTIGWDFSGKIPQVLSPSKYPFDHPHIPLLIGPQNVTENVILVPDFAYYNARSANQHIGIGQGVTVPGFTIRSSIFDFTTEKEGAAVGISSPQAAQRFTLTFNLFLQRRLLEALFIYFLPLFLMLIFIYSTIFLLWDLNTKAIGLKQTAKYASILFALLLLHRGLRSTFHTNDMLYLEWIFVSAYVTQIYLISYSMVKTIINLSRSHRYHPLLVYTFWPLQIVLWLTITFTTFYAG